MKRNIKKVIVSVVIVIVAMLLLVASIIGIRKLRQSMFQPEKVVEENTPVEEVIPTEETTPSEEVTATEEVVEETEEVSETEEKVNPNVKYTNPFKEGVDSSKFSSVTNVPDVPDDDIPYVSDEIKEEIDANMSYMDTDEYAELMEKHFEEEAKRYEEELKKAQEMQEAGTAQ